MESLLTMMDATVKQTNITGLNYVTFKKCCFVWGFLEGGGGLGNSHILKIAGGSNILKIPWGSNSALIFC